VVDGLRHTEARRKCVIPCDVVSNGRFGSAEVVIYKELSRFRCWLHWCSPLSPRNLPLLHVALPIFFFHIKKSVTEINPFDQSTRVYWIHHSGIKQTTPKTAKPNWSHSPTSRLEWFWTSLSQNYHQLSLILLVLAKFLLCEHHNGIHWLASEKEIFSSTPPRRRQTTRGIHETTGHRQKMERLSAQIWYYKGNEWQCGNALWEYNFEWECRDEEGCRRHES